MSAAFLAAAPSASAGSAWTIPRAVSATGGPEGLVRPAVDPALLDFARGPVGSKPYWDKLTPTIQDAALSGTGFVNVAILTDDVVELGAFLRAHGVDTRYGLVPSGQSDLRPVRIEIPAGLVEKVASLDHVFLVAPAVIPEAPSLVDPDLPTAAGLGFTPTLIEAGKGHSVPEAWSLGVTGAGVNVAVMDSGIDFGHPDLQGTYATVSDPFSPYDGWPIAFDPYSMFVYMLADQTFQGSGVSWYVNTAFTTTADPFTGLIDIPFMGRVYDVSGIPSASGEYRLGLHPDRTLRFSTLYGYNQYVGVLLADSTFPGVYDTVYVDLDHDKRFWDDKPADVSSPVIWADYYHAGTGIWDNSSYMTGDGISDMSGGMVYFIADGSTPIPYTDVIASRYSLPLPVPDSGDLVTFMLGDSRALGGGDHGTFCASAVVAQNVTGTVQGFAPDAKMIAVGNIYVGGFFDDIWTFVAEGYDVVPGSGDEAMVASASFGSGSVDNDGWDFESRWVELHAFSYFGTSYVVSSGNGGHGFGTVNTPGGSNGVITVGASTSYYGDAAFPLGASDTGAHATFGDVQPWSDRGPSAVGKGKPDIVTIGAWATGDGALNTFGGRAPPWGVWGGTSLSAPATMGIVALIGQAWMLNPFGGGAPPDSILSKFLLLSGADNIHYDGQVMGHGLANAYRSVQGALFMDGVLAYDLGAGYPYTSWNAGDYRGTVYPSFTRTMSPGTTNTTEFLVFNLNLTVPKDVTISDWELQKTGSDTFTISASNANESPPDFARPDYLIDLTSYVPPGTNLVKATVSFPKAQFDWNGDYASDSRWRVLLYDWLDYNGNGSYWTDTNGNGVVNTGEMDATMGTEIQRFTYGYPTHTNIQAYVHDPLSRIHYGLLLGIQHRTVSASIPVTTLTVTVDYYAAVDAPWLTTDITATTLPAFISPILLTLNVTLPPGQPLGALSGMVTISNATWPDGGEMQIPVLVNVAATGPDFAFGGDPASDAFLDNNRMFAGIGWGDRSESGDWRFFYTDIPDDWPIDPGDSLLVHTTWESTPTDIDTFIMGPTADMFTPGGPWGPYTLATVGQSSPQMIASGTWRFQTATGLADEWVAAPLQTGLHAIALHNVQFAGNGPSEVFDGQVGTFGVSPSPWSVSTYLPTGTDTFDTMASLDLPGLSVLGYGVSQPSYDGSVPIVDQANYLEMFSATSIGLIDVITTGPGDMDIDLYLDRCGSGSCTLTGAGWSQVASSAGATADERIRLTRPVDGQYRIRVFGFSVPGGFGTFSLARAVVSGTHLSPAGVPTDPIPAGTPSSFDVDYDFGIGMAPGYYLGILFVGPENAPSVEVLAEFLVYDGQAPVMGATSPAPGDSLQDTTPPITADYVDPEITSGIAMVALTLDGFDVTFAGSFNATRFTWAMPFALGEGPHIANLTVSDVAGFWASYEWTFTIDTTAPSLTLTEPTATLTSAATIDVAGTVDDPSAEVFVVGVGSVALTAGAFSTTVDLAEGPNTITVYANDTAGHSTMAVRSVTRDSTAPSLAVSTPAAASVLGTSVVRVSGTTEAGAELTVNGIRVVVSGSGGFSVDLSLADGTRTITTVATDAAGNAAQDVRSVTIDTAAPTVLLTAPTMPITNSASVTVSGTVSEPTAVVRVVVNGVPGSPLSVNPATGAFSTTVTLAEGTSLILVTATDAALNAGSASTGILVDLTAPALTVTAPAQATETDQPSVEVRGVVDDPTATVLVNGQRVTPASDGTWSVTVALTEGLNGIEIGAVDAAGNTAPTVTRAVTYTSPIPEIEQDLTDNAQSINGLTGMTTYGLIGVLVVLLAVQIGLYWNLNRKVEGLKAPKAQEPPPPPEEKKGEP